MLIRILSAEYHLLNKGQYANEDPFRGVLYLERRTICLYLYPGEFIYRTLWFIFHTVYTAKYRM